MELGDAIDQGDQDATDPTVDQVQADQRNDMPAVPVRHEGPVLVHPLPARSGAARSYTITSAATPVLGRDERRKRAVVYSFTVGIAFGFTAGECQASTAAKWPIEKPLELENVDELWVRSTGGDTEVTVFDEHWSR